MKVIDLFKEKVKLCGFLFIKVFRVENVVGLFKFSNEGNVIIVNVVLGGVFFLFKVYSGVEFFKIAKVFVEEKSFSFKG